MRLEGKLPQIIIFLVAAVLVFLIIKQYIGVLAFAALLAYLIYPIYLRLTKKITETGAAILITCAALVLAILIIYYGITIILNEFGRVYLFFSNLPLENLSPTIKNILGYFVPQLISSLSNAVYQLPKSALSFIVFFISLFYLLKEGRRIVKLTMGLLPISEGRREAIVRSISRQAEAFVHVQIVIGIIQGMVAGFGFYIFGLPYPLLGGIIAGILSVLPVLGPYLLYMPIGIFTVLQGNINSGIGILIYGLILGSLLDYVVRPHLIGRRASVHPLIIFIGVLGGMRLLGVVGLFVGPVLLSMAITVLREMYADFAE